MRLLQLCAFILLLLGSCIYSRPQGPISDATRNFSQLVLASAGDSNRLEALSRVFSASEGLLTNGMTLPSYADALVSNAFVDLLTNDTASLLPVHRALLSDVSCHYAQAAKLYLAAFALAPGNETLLVDAVSSATRDKTQTNLVEELMYECRQKIHDQYLLDLAECRYLMFKRDWDRAAEALEEAIDRWPDRAWLLKGELLIVHLNQTPLPREKSYRLARELLDAGYEDTWFPGVLLYLTPESDTRTRYLAYRMARRLPED